jgi:histidinol-phosphate/aromatic aminotransferase/cobyric acid decarboxylase-like protein
LASLEDREALQKRVEFNNSEIGFIEESLSDIPGLVTFHSHGNYILLDGTDTGKKGQDMVDFACERGLIFRPQPSMYGRDGWFRITIGSAEENRMAVKTIREFYTS